MSSTTFGFQGTLGTVNRGGLTNEPEDSTIPLDLMIPLANQACLSSLHLLLFWCSDPASFHEEQIRTQLSKQRRVNDQYLALLVETRVNLEESRQMAKFFNPTEAVRGSDRLSPGFF